MNALNRLVTLLEPYSYGLLGKLAYLGRVVRGTYRVDITWTQLGRALSEAGQATRAAEAA